MNIIGIFFSWVSLHVTLLILSWNFLSSPCLSCVRGLWMVVKSAFSVFHTRVHLCLRWTFNCVTNTHSMHTHNVYDIPHALHKKPGSLISDFLDLQSQFLACLTHRFSSLNSSLLRALQNHSAANSPNFIPPAFNFFFLLCFLFEHFWGSNSGLISATFYALKRFLNFLIKFIYFIGGSTHNCL